MKKIFSILLIVAAVLLTACGKKDTAVSTRTDLPSSNSISTLKLESVKNGKKIKTVEADDNYYIIKIAEDAKGSLFVHNTALDATIAEKKNLLRTINVSPLTFTSQINSYEVNEIMQEVFDSENGITSDSLGVDFDLKASKKWTVNIDCADVVEAYMNDNQRDNYFSKIYLPMYVEHYENNEPTLKVYVMVPIYYGFTLIVNGENNDSTFTGYNVPTLTFDAETNLLK